MSTASAPSQFWGVVAIALNSALQPTGQICGGTDSPLLRLSPPFQIANAIILVYHSVRLSFAIDLPFRIALGVVAERAGLYKNRSGITEPERHFFFRVLVFIFGALPTAIKALAIRRDWVSYWLVLGFFVPFLILELIKQLKKKPSPARLAEANSMPADKNLDMIVYRHIAAIPALTIHVSYFLEAVNWALMKSILKAKSFEDDALLTSLPALIPMCYYLSLKIDELAPKGIRFWLVAPSLCVGGLFFLHRTFVVTVDMWGRWPELVIAILTIAVVTTGTLAHLFLYLCFTSTAPRELLGGDQNRHRQKFMEQWVALWSVGCIFLYYGYLYDASSTYKPAWTEWLP